MLTQKINEANDEVVGNNERRDQVSENANNFVAINEAACGNGRSLVQELIPGGKFRSLEYLVSNATRGSFSINYRTGKWRDFAANENGGDFVSLVAYLRHCSRSDAARQLAATVVNGHVLLPASASQAREEESACGATSQHFKDDEPAVQDGEIPRSSESPWDNPDWSMLEDRRGDLPEFPIDALDPASQDFIERASHGAGVTHAHVAVPLLSVVSAQIGTARRIAPSRAWSEPATMWSAVVGFSGSGKTPGLDVVKRHLAFVERQQRQKFAKLQRDHETKAEIARAAHKKWEKEVQVALEEGVKPPECPPEARELPEFILPRLYVSDTTVERIAVLQQARPYGLMVITDELAGLFLNMGRYSKGSDREFWLEAWNGKSYTQERMGRSPVVLKHLLVGITGGFQPDKLVRSFQGDDDGMYARLLFTWPSEPKYRPLSNDVAEIEPEFVNALARIIDLTPTMADAENVVRQVSLTTDALDSFENFRRDCHSRRAALDGREREWWAKGPSQVLRLALTLSFLSWSWKVRAPEPSRVDLETMSAAIRIWRDYFWPHARAALRQTGVSKSQSESRRVLKWIRSSVKPGDKLSLQQVRRNALAQSLAAEGTGQLLQRLEAAGWLKKTTTRTQGRPRERWEINPKLFTDAASAESAEIPDGPFAEAAE